ncbi:MAG: hypothetical protein QOE08_89 [Thermoleophilaceae bacterium]|nr:hypothetical protein [Thermoleophilaceae bacterium]
MVSVEIRTLREGERATRLLDRLEGEVGVVGIEVIGGRLFAVEAADWPAASARLDDILTRVAGDQWREYLAFVAPQGYERPASRDRL